MKSSKVVTDTLSGGGEMGARMRALDWSRTAVGPVEDWPQSLRTSVSILLNSRFPMMIHWGPELTQFYNDAYIPSLGSKHPGALGQPAQPWWAEIWDVLEPMFQRVLAGEATWYENQLFLPNRSGFIEEAYFTLSHSPIRDETGGVSGIFLAVKETTGQVVGERRLRALKALSEATAGQSTAEAACVAAARVLEGYRHDVPFALLYLTDMHEGVLRCAASVGLDPSSPAAPAVVPLHGQGTEVPWPLGAVALGGEARTLTDVSALAASLPGGPWPEPTRTVLVLPVGKEGEAAAAGVLVAGISPRRALDADYRNYLTLVAGQVATAIASARRAEAQAELDRAKTDFFSNVSHEFRTPLTLLLGPLEEALADTALSGRQRERVLLAQSGAQRLLKLVNTLLTFSRLEAGRQKATFELTNLSELTAGLASSFESTLTRAGLRLVVDCPPLPEGVWVDREAWEQIVLNLVSNAFKFTFTGEVRVSLRWRGAEVTLSVADTGTGIPENELPRIFERFHRVEGARGRSFEGSGIGLALVQELVKLHGGSVRARSVPGKGSTFAVSIPTGNAHLAAERLGSRQTRDSQGGRAAAFVEEAEAWLENGPSQVPPSAARDLPPSQPESGPALSSGHVLLVDDNARMRGYLRRLLEERGYEVEEVADGQAALRAARAWPPDVVLSDVMMPGLDGFGLLRQLKSEARTADVPIILLSARAGEEATVEGLAAGASDYLVKPFSARELLARVDGTLRTARARADLDAFAGRIAHDLRNLLSPLVMIGAQVRATADERAKRAGERLERIIRRAHNLLDGMLAFSRAKGAVEVSGGVSVPPVAADVVEDLSTLRELVGAELDINGVEDVEVALPRGLLYVVLLNLVSNALKFMEDRPTRRVEVTARASGAWCELAVRDTGPGIPPEVMRHIFEPFYRAPEAKASGHGIGLATVQRIARACGGEITVHSVVGEGSTFTVRLPRRPASRA